MSRMLVARSTMSHPPRSPVARCGRGLATALLAGAVATGVQGAGALDKTTEIEPFAVQMVERHGVGRAEIERILGEAKVLPAVLAAISRPAEAKPWSQYRPIFLTEARIDAGVVFSNTHAGLLRRVEAAYGVPAEVVVAILGVETLYGQRAGKIRVLDSLATLGFRYPRRANFFLAELEQYLLLVREEGLDPLSLRGSYAGAMGIPQFISSSYRRYAIDFDGDNVRDLLTSVPDAVGSVANYLKLHDWRHGESVAVPATVRGEAYRALLEQDLKPSTSITAMSELGVSVEGNVDGARSGALIELQGADGPEYWVGLQNFYVITRYNHSKLYAMAVHQLADEIRRRRGDKNG